MQIEKSDIVMSLNGRDAGKPFYVLEIEGEYSFLADGKVRRVEKPKQKKLKHIKFEKKDTSRVGEKIRSGEKITNSEIRRSLAEQFAEGRGEKGGMQIG